MSKENLYTPKCIRTFTGKYFNVFDIDPGLICIEDIAHGLSMQCRFGGHTHYFYSVAQHSIEVALLCPFGQRLAGLLHDASEAYLLDIPRPIKNQLLNYKEIEHNLMLAISEKFGFQYPFCRAVKQNDEIILKDEWESLVITKPERPDLTHMKPQDAKETFIEFFEDYKINDTALEKSFDS